MNTMLVKCSAAALFWLVAVTAADAQTSYMGAPWTPDLTRQMDYTGRLFSPFVHNALHDSARDNARLSGIAGQASSNPVQSSPLASSRGGGRSAVSFVATKDTNVAAKLSESYPAPKREEVRRVFADLLSMFHEVERSFGISRHDLAGAVAMFLAGSYEAYTDRSIEPSDFKALVGQMQQIIATNPEFEKASNAEKQEMYEQMAILGMFMAGTQDELSRKPNPRIAANMKQAAKGYLEQFLKTDAERVQITERGLEIR